METKNLKELWVTVVEDRLGTALIDPSNKESFKEALDAQNQINEIDKIEESKKEGFKNRIVKVVEIAAIPVAVVVIDNLFKRGFMKDVCNFEKDYTFTTGPGRAVSQFFKWKR